MKKISNYKKYLAFALMFAFSATSWADKTAELTHRVNDAVSVLNHAVEIPDSSIPTSLLNRATCVAVFPSIVKVGFIVGAKHGDGLVSCRSTAGWSEPSFIAIGGGSFGPQIGIESTELILVFMQPDAVERFTKNTLTLGGDIAVAAGPIGRDAEAGVATSDAAVYAYSRNKGVFAGIALDGSVLSVDDKDNMVAYGQQMRSADLLATPLTNEGLMVSPFVDALNRIAPRM